MPDPEKKKGKYDTEKLKTLSERIQEKQFQILCKSKESNSRKISSDQNNKESEGK